jgi:type I restriction enzyme, S subunit
VRHELPRAGLKTPLHSTHWETRRFKYLFERVRRPVPPETEVVTAFRDGVVTRRSNRREDGFTFADKEIGYQGIEVGDLAIHAMDGFAGAIGVSDSRGKVSPVLSVCVPKAEEPAEPRFWAYYLRNLAKTGFIESLAKGIRERSTDFRWKDAAELLVNFPDLHTQKAIADFLDKETARIDQLIEKKQRLVELLGERLSSEIESAVVGLGVGGERKPVPGVPWIKDVPATWSIQPLRRLLAMPITDGPHETPEFLDEGVPFVSAEAVSSGEIDFARIRGFISAADNARYSRKYAPKTGDIYVVKSGATTGRAAIVRDFTEFNIWSPLAVLRPKAEVPSSFLLTLVRSDMFQRALSLSWSWGTQQNIGMGSLGRIAVPVPTPEERREIGASAAGAASHASTLLQPVRTSIDRLKEYRSALITAAVTGQIDVTRWGQTGEGDKRLDQIQEEMAG